MLQEWLLIVWLGTSTNFMLYGIYWNFDDCNRARLDLASQVDTNYVLVCTQDMRQGRSNYPGRPGSAGIAK